MKSIAELKEQSDLDGQSDDQDEIADETRPLQHEQASRPFVPLILRLDIKVAENETKQLVIDRTVDDPR